MQYALTRPCNLFYFCFIAAASRPSGRSWLQGVDELLQRDRPAASSFN